MKLLVWSVRHPARAGPAPDSAEGLSLAVFSAIPPTQNECDRPGFGFSGTESMLPPAKELPP